MKNDLIERYVYAVVKQLPRKNREDVAMELRSLIDDMLAERCPMGMPTEKDIRVVLTELGTPQELYAKYDEDADKCLIGQPYYSTYKFVLKIVLISVSIGMAVSGLILQIMEPKGILEAIGTGLSMVYDGLLSTFAIVTLLFAFFCRKGVKLTEPFNFDDLPPVPKKKQEISKLDSIVGIGFDVVFLAIFLAAPQLLGMYTMGSGEIIPIFNVTAIRANWLVIVLFGALGILREIVKLMEGRYNRKVLITTAAADLLSAGTAIWWLTDENMFNPQFTQSILAQVGSDDVVVMRIFENFPRFFLGVMLFALALDLINAIVKALQK